MKKLLISAGLVFAVAAAVQAQDMYGTDMKNMPMEGNETQGSQAAPTASAEGTIKLWNQVKLPWRMDQYQP